jgi:tRNA (cmo5U34)-methyltransferase
MKDDLYRSEQKPLLPFAFDEKVASVFPDMIRRSVPGYHEALQGIAEISKIYWQADTDIYDLGCSWAAASLAIDQQLQQQALRIIAIDNSLPMLKRAKDFLSHYHHYGRIDLLCADINNVYFSNSSVMILQYTLQFLAPEARSPLLKKIYHALMPQGVLILSEKIHHLDSNAEALWQKLHQQFKQQQGYSALEIHQKRNALENVLRTDTLETHYQRLREVGFQTVVVWLQRFNFVSLLAFK